MVLNRPFSLLYKLYNIDFAAPKKSKILLSRQQNKIFRIIQILTSVL